MCSTVWQEQTDTVPKPTRKVTALAAATLRSVVTAWNLRRVHNISSNADVGKSASWMVSLRWRSGFTREWFDTWHKQIHRFQSHSCGSGRKGVTSKNSALI